MGQYFSITCALLYAAQTVIEWTNYFSVKMMEC